MADTPNLGMPELAHKEQNGELTHNTSLQILDLHAQPVVVNHAQDGVPGTPVNGGGYIISANPWGGGNVNDVAHYYNGEWYFYVPMVGWRFFSQADLNTYYWTGAQWDVYIPANLPEPAYGQVAADGGNLTQALTTTPTPVAGYEVIDLQNNISVSLTTNRANMTLLTDFEGLYRFAFNVSFGGTGNVEHLFEVYVNGAPTGTVVIVDLTNSQTSGGTASLSGVLTDLLNVGDIVEVYAYTGSGSSTVTYFDLIMTLERAYT